MVNFVQRRIKRLLQELDAAKQTPEQDDNSAITDDSTIAAEEQKEDPVEETEQRHS